MVKELWSILRASINFMTLICSSLLVVSCRVPATKPRPVWTAQQELQHFRDRQDSTTWDMGMLDDELKYAAEKYPSEPMTYGIFPVPEYDRAGKGSFRGLGFYNDWISFGEQGEHLIWSIFYVKRNTLNEVFLRSEQPDEAFFSVVVLSNVPIDTLNYSHLHNEVISRNHPDYIGQGTIQLQKSQVDYLAFLTARRDSYAVINMRLFNLRHGQIVLVAPQADGSFRSMQLDPGSLSVRETDEYIRRLSGDSLLTAFLSDISLPE